MAKKKKYPKTPKKSASLAMWQRYDGKKKDVDKFNKQIDADKKKKEAIIKKNNK